MPDASGGWTGLAVVLWESIAARAGITTEYVELPFEDLIPSVREGKVDLALGEFLVNPDWEELIDFSQPYLDTTLGIAVDRRHWKPSWVHVLQSFWTPDLLKVIAGVFAGLLLTTLLIWLIERKRNAEHFGGKAYQGLGSALWFAVVTMTSVGYGDKAPMSALGRLVAGLWMFAGLLLLTAYTAAVASTIASSQTRFVITSGTDLRHYTNGVLAGDAAQTSLETLGARTVAFESIEEALSKLAVGELDTVVADANSLRFLLSRDDGKPFLLLPLSLGRYRVAFALPEDSPQREFFNVELLRVIFDPSWNSVLENYLGPPIVGHP